MDSASAICSATAAASYKFVNWTENGTPVCATRNYTFNASSDRTLVANFVPGKTNVTVLLSRPHDGSGTIMKSAWYPPDGLDGDQYVFDSFSFGTTQTVTEVRWRGGYTNYKSGAGKAPVYDFTVRIYASLLAGGTGFVARLGKRFGADLSAAALEGTAEDEFARRASRFLESARHPLFDAPLADVAYQPMRELVALLRDRKSTRLNSSHRT